MPFYILCLLSLWTSLTQTQSTPNLQDYWSKIFSTTTRPLQSQPDRGSLKVCGLNKECVQRFLCEQNGEVNRYGKALINIRFGADIAEEDSCTYLETCCDVNVKVVEISFIRYRISINYNALLTVNGTERAHQARKRRLWLS